MSDSRYPGTMGRRDALLRIAGTALSVAGLSAFRPFAPKGTKWDDRYELAVDFDIATQQGARYHRPYVAVWVEDAAGKPVRTLSLWVNTSGRGPRYIKEIRRWVDAARDTQDAGGPDLVATVSSATRSPGRYLVTWNGRDDRGNVVEQGTYRLFIEAAREHGSYQLIQQDLTLATKPVAMDLGANEEIGRARVEYRLRK